MAKVLVTGGLGYIGSHTVLELLKLDHEVIIVDNLSNSKIEVLNRVEKIAHRSCSFYKVDLCDKKGINEVFKKENDIRSVIHFAASKAVGESVTKPLLYYKNNILSLVNLLDLMAVYNINQLVFSSSCTVYGQPENLPVLECSPIQKAASPYGNTKQICEEIIEDTIKANPFLRAISLRYFNPVGAHESATIGELPLGAPGNLVPLITQTAAGIRNELQIFGNNYSTPDGTAIRDFIHVTDLAEAHVAALTNMDEGTQLQAYNTYNIGTGKGYSVLEVVKAFERVNNVKLKYSFSDRRCGDVEKIYADCSKANKELGWKATKNLDEMLKTAWEWQKNI